jgi:peptide deformylase
MAVRKVLRMGDPRLQQVASKVTQFGTAELHQLIEDMLDTMRAEDGAGLAAPQIGVDARVVVFEVSSNPRYPEAEAVPRTILINPEITIVDKTEESCWEGCLSVPGLRGLVSRPIAVEYRGFDAVGQPIQCNAQGFHARVVQHECDHLDGILYPQRMHDFSQFGYIDELVESEQLQAQPCDDV